jgi:hypothetical protein
MSDRSARDQAESFSDIIRRSNREAGIAAGTSPLRHTIAPRVLPSAPFGDMVVIALKWTLAIAIAWVILGLPIGLILYFALR